MKIKFDINQLMERWHIFLHLISHGTVFRHRCSMNTGMGNQRTIKFNFGKTTHIIIQFQAIISNYLLGWLRIGSLDICIESPLKRLEREILDLKREVASAVGLERGGKINVNPLPGSEPIDQGEI